MKSANILELLPVGEANAIQSQTLADLCGYESIRKLQLDIEALRNQGHVICSTSRPPGDYFISQNQAELAAFVKTLENRAKSTFRSLRSARQALRDLDKAE